MAERRMTEYRSSAVRNLDVIFAAGCLSFLWMATYTKDSIGKYYSWMTLILSVAGFFGGYALLRLWALRERDFRVLSDGQTFLFYAGSGRHLYIARKEYKSHAIEGGALTVTFIERRETLIASCEAISVMKRIMDNWLAQTPSAA